MSLSPVFSLPTPITLVSQSFDEGYVFSNGSKVTGMLGEFYIRKENPSKHKMSNKSQEDILTREHSSISRDHLWVLCCREDEFTEQKVMLIDRNSKFGSYIDGERISELEIITGKYDLILGNVQFNMEYIL